MQTNASEEGGVNFGCFSSAFVGICIGSIENRLWGVFVDDYTHFIVAFFFVLSILHATCRSCDFQVPAKRYKNRGFVARGRLGGVFLHCAMVLGDGFRGQIPAKSSANFNGRDFEGRTA